MISIIAVAGVVIVAAGVYAVSKKPQGNHEQDSVQPVEISEQVMGKTKEPSVQKEEKVDKSLEVPDVTVKEEKPVSQSDYKKNDKAIYTWLNGLIREMFYHYRTDSWSELTSVEPLTNADSISFDVVMGKLKKDEKEILERSMECVSVEDGSVKDQDALKELFFDMVLDFYPAYYYVFGKEIRHTAFLNKTTLKLFHQLTGKRFQLGYRNRHASGVNSFTMEGDRYQVYDKDGKLVCDAIFKDHKIYEGFGTELMEGEAEESWKALRCGQWKEGNFENGYIHYLYGKPVGLV